MFSLKLALRTLLKTPFVTIVAALSLSATDPVVMIVSVMLLTFVALGAGYVPRSEHRESIPCRPFAMSSSGG